jgi:hypothetical protein
MKNEIGTPFAAAAFAIAGMTTAQAADIAAMTGHVAKLDADSSALVYYIVAPDGFHMVVTTQHGLADQAAVARFETVLAAGQSAAGLGAARRRRGAGADRAQQRRRPPAHRQAERRRFRPVISGPRLPANSSPYHEEK